MPYEVFVFDGEGGVIEANIIDAPNPSVPKTVSSVSPLRVVFERDDGKTTECSGEFSEAAWHHDVQKGMDLQQRLDKIVASWQRSDNTNFEVVQQAIDSALANSQK